MIPQQSLTSLILAHFSCLGDAEIIGIAIKDILNMNLIFSDFFVLLPFKNVLQKL